MDLLATRKAPGDEAVERRRGVAQVLAPVVEECGHAPALGEAEQQFAVVLVEDRAGGDGPSGVDFALAGRVELQVPQRARQQPQRPHPDRHAGAGGVRRVELGAEDAMQDNDVASRGPARAAQVAPQGSLVQTLVAGGAEIADERLFLVSRRAGHEPRQLVDVGRLEALDQSAFLGRGQPRRRGGAGYARGAQDVGRLFNHRCGASFPDGGRHPTSRPGAGASGGHSQRQPRHARRTRERTAAVRAPASLTVPARRAARVSAASVQGRLNIRPMRARQPEPARP